MTGSLRVKINVSHAYKKNRQFYMEYPPGTKSGYTIELETDTTYISAGQTSFLQVQWGKFALVRVL